VISAQRAMLLLSISSEDLALAGASGGDASLLRAEIHEAQIELAQMSTRAEQLSAAKTAQARKRAQRHAISPTERAELESLEAAYRAEQGTVRGKVLAEVGSEVRQRLEVILRHKQYEVRREYLAIDCSEEQMGKLQHACIALAAAGNNIDAITLEDRAVIQWAEAIAEVAIARANFETRLSSIQAVLQS